MGFTCTSTLCIADDRQWISRICSDYFLLENIFVDTSDENGQKKLLTCFDVSPDNRLLAAGTELYEADAYILFWDIRNTKLLGGYWESHTDDITDVNFSIHVFISYFKL